MQFSSTIFAIATLLSLTSALPSTDASNLVSARQAGGFNNQGRPVANGACCVPNTSKKQDVCKVDGQAGLCIPGGPANCNGALNCVVAAGLTCDPNVLENGRPRCR